VTCQEQECDWLSDWNRLNSSPPLFYFPALLVLLTRKIQYRNDVQTFGDAAMQHNEQYEIMDIPPLRHVRRILWEK
jgi:hypothetical protein